MKTQFLSHSIAFLIGILLVLALISLSPDFASTLLPNSSLVQPIFSPGSEKEIISLINSASSSVDVEVYTFTNRNIADALINASERGIQVRVILESRLVNPKYNQDTARYLSANGVQVRFASPKYALTHSKLMIIDGKKVLVGSINFSNNAVLKNREAAAVIYGPAVAQYAEIFKQDWEDALEID
jgi:phosphatidylserine/phosphatidylglycerophosphate/cardiolipin synthase-like enzyme